MLLASTTIRKLVMRLLVPVRTVHWAECQVAKLGLMRRSTLGLLLRTVLMLLRGVRDANRGLVRGPRLHLQVMAMQAAPSKASFGMPCLDMARDGISDFVSVAGCPRYCF